MDSENDLVASSTAEGLQHLANSPEAIGRMLTPGVSLDLEVSVKDRHIRAFAGVSRDTGQSLTFPTRVKDWPRRWPDWTVSPMMRPSCWATT